MATPGSSDLPRHLLSVDDLDDALIDHVRAAVAAPPPPSLDRAGRILGLLVLEPSLRTRVGFVAAAARLGATTVEISDPRHAAGQSTAESFEDTLRTLASLVDLIVVRSPWPLDGPWLRAEVDVPVINAGDGGNQHPTQALVDLLAIEQLRGPTADLVIGISGDLGSRCVRSFLGLLDRFPPRRLVLSAPEGRDAHGLVLGPTLLGRIERRPVLDVNGLDVVYLPGLTEGVGPGSVTAEVRARFALGALQLGRLDPASIVLSPMPVIDELDDAARADPRTKLFEAVVLGDVVRQALLRAVWPS